jgi:hypothetical protein
MSLCGRITVLLLGLAVCSCGDSSRPDGGTILCDTDQDCPLGQYCDDGICTGLRDGGECARNLDCRPGEVCIDGSCVPAQTDGGDGEDGWDLGPPIPDIQAEPESLNFGNGRVGQSVEQQLLIRNAGGAELTVFSVTLEDGSSPEFSAHPQGTLNAAVAPGFDLPLVVRYLPVDGLTDSGALLISSDDPDQALLRVPLSSSYKGASEITAVAEAGEVEPELLALDFGKIPVGDTSQLTLYVKNTGRGNAVLGIQDVRTEPPSSVNFELQVSPDPPIYLSPDQGPCFDDADCPSGHTCVSGACINGQGEVPGAVTIKVHFTPQNTGSIRESLVIANDEGDGGGDGVEHPLQVDLLGEGIQPALEVNPAPVAFGQRFVGHQAEMEVALRNVGGEVLQVTAAFLADGTGPFSLDSGGATQWTLQPAEEAILTARYLPAAPGSHQDVLVVQSDDPDSPLRVDFLGSAVLPPVLEVDPPAIDFGEVQLGEVSSAFTTLTNNGGSDLVVSRIELLAGSSTAFTVLQSALLPIPAGDSARVDVVYVPVDPVGADEGTFRITSNDPAAPEVIVEMSGVGTDPRVEVTPASVDFGSIYLGFEAGPATITVRNTGVGSLSVTAVGIGAGSNPDFELRNTPVLPASLAPGASLGLEVYFTPLASGQRSAAVQVLNSDRDSPLVSVPVAGTGTDCPPGYWDINGDPGDGCEYACDLTNGGVEDCDNLDNDCDAQTDEGLTTRTCESTNQYGTCTGTETCDGPNGWVGCDAPDAEEEVCDGRDNDCDGATDRADNSLRKDPCENQDGACLGAIHRADLCQNGSWQPCQNIDYLVNPAYGAEICDDVDNDCDADTDTGCDDDSDGWCDAAMGHSGSPAICPNGFDDCNDTDPLVHPGAPEDCATAHDDDCDGQTNEPDAAGCTDFYHDGDHDGFGTDEAQCLCNPQGNYSAELSGDCNDGNDAVNPGALEDCATPWDDDCSGQTNDRDLDGDGYREAYLNCGGDDCNDLNPQAHPGATEVLDTFDNDCNGLVDEGHIPAGAVVITEIMQDPDAVDDIDGEWIELTNVWIHPVNLHSWAISDNGSNEITIDRPSGVLIDPGETAVLCSNATFTENGGIDCDYDYDWGTIDSTLALGNEDDEVILKLDGVEIDRVEYTGSSPWPDPTGRSINLDPNAYDKTGNDDGENWCTTPAEPAYQLPSGDYGTPGDLNYSCSGDLAVLNVVPDSGIDDGGETVMIIGAGFTVGCVVKIGASDCGGVNYIDDYHLSCVTPGQAPGDYDVTVERGVNQKTLTSGYRYTGVAASPGIGWCDLQWPATYTTPAGTPTELIFGRVYKEGVTEPAGPPAGIGAQVGYGPVGTDPRSTPGWLWFDAVWNVSCEYCGNDDEFMKSLTITTPGTYSYTYRFSEDGGFTFVYTDFNPGTSDGFSTGDLGTLTVE